MSFQQGLSGLNSASKNLDVIGNNVANSNTIGFKGAEAQFADVYANSQFGAGGAAIGIGVSMTTVAQSFAQGNINISGNPLDVAINGSGFYRLDSGGTVTYSRNGQFQLDKNGYVVTTSGENLTGYPAGANGAITTAAPVPLQMSVVGLAPAPTTAATVSVTLDSRKPALSAAAFNLADSATYSSATSISVFDSLGNPSVLSTYYVKNAANDWSVFAASDGVQIGAGPIGAMTFNTDGSVASAPDIPLTIPVTTGAAPIAMTLKLDSGTQVGRDFSVNSLAQDGYGPGQLTGFAIDGFGVITGRYSNGQARPQGQISLTNFTNPQGLQNLGANQWAETGTSGAPLTGAPGSGNLGLLQSGALEASNVDLTEELVDMITAQRVYQANAQTIKTQDSVLQTLVNLR